MYEIHELLAGLLSSLLGISGIIIFVLFIFGLILLFLLPFFVFRIRNEIIILNNNVTTLIETVTNINDLLIIRRDDSNQED